MDQEELRFPLNSDMTMVRPVEGNLATGLIWGVLISIPLWISVVGWVSVIMR